MIKTTNEPSIGSRGTGSPPPLFFPLVQGVRGAQRKTPRLSMRHNYIIQLYRQKEQSQKEMY